MRYLLSLGKPVVINRKLWISYCDNWLCLAQQIWLTGGVIAAEMG
jgi:hypothetical protein